MRILLVPERAVDLVPLQQFLMPPDVVDYPAIEHENGVRIRQRRKPVRDNDQRPATRDPRNVGVHDGLAISVECARCLVKNEDRRIDDQRTCDRKPLPLSSGEIGRPFIDVGFVAARQPVDEFLSARQPRRLDDIVEGRVRLGCR